MLYRLLWASWLLTCLFFSLNYNGLNVALTSLFNTLPMSVFGRPLRNSINLGTLYGVISFLQYAIISSRVSSDGSKPGFNTMTAATVSPRYSWGIPITAASATHG